MKIAGNDAGIRRQAGSKATSDQAISAPKVDDNAWPRSRFCKNPLYLPCEYNSLYYFG
jgi:hypothetical protein